MSILLSLFNSIVGAKFKLCFMKPVLYGKPDLSISSSLIFDEMLVIFAFKCLPRCSCKEPKKIIENNISEQVINKIETKILLWSVFGDCSQPHHSADNHR